MINEQKTEQNTSIKTKNSCLVSEKINLFSLYSFFLNYLRRQKLVLIFAVIIIPIGILCQAIFANRRGPEIMPLSIGITFIATGTSVAMYMMMGFLIDLKMSVVYKRIGLLGIKPLGFILIVYTYCFTLVLIADLWVLIGSFIITAILKIDFAIVYNFIVFLAFFISIFVIAFAIGLMLIAVILINSRTMQSLITDLFSLLFVGGSFVAAAFIPALFGHNYQHGILSVTGLSISIGIIIGLILLTSVTLWLIMRIFRWDNVNCKSN